MFLFSFFSVKESDSYSSAGLSLLYMDYELSYTVIAYLDTFYPFPVFLKLVTFSSVARHLAKNLSFFLWKEKSTHSPVNKKGTGLFLESPQL